MPNIVTHTLFADDVSQLVDLDVFLGRNQLFEIGANGPDFLFFHGISPWKTPVLRHHVRKIGGALHKANINDFYKSALNSIRREKNNQIRDDMIVYTAGHLCHWALDSTMHPYIFYKTGFRTGRNMWMHHRFESLMDAIMLKLKRGLTIEEYDVTRITKHKPFQARAIARIYVPAIKEIFQEDIRPYIIEEALQDWNDMQAVFRDVKGKKIAAAQKLEKPMGLSNLISGYMIPPEAEDNYDVLNLLHTPWKNPATGEISTETVLELYDKAVIKAVRAITLFFEAVADRSKEEAFFDFLDDQNYETSTRGLPMRFQDPLDMNL